jgi:hypothetical protein
MVGINYPYNTVFIATDADYLTLLKQSTGKEQAAGKQPKVN